MSAVQPQITVSRHEIIQNELRWHEEEAHRRETLDHYLYDPPVFDNVIAAQLDHLALNHGRHLLEMACGPGKETLAFSNMGQSLVSFDLSYVQVSAARDYVLRQNPTAQVHFVQANAEELPFADESFSAIYGKAVLHHLDLSIAAAEVKRLLCSNGRASFAEPLAWHPMIWLGRRLTPSLRTRDEHPLRYDELEEFAGQFDHSQTAYVYLVMPLAYLLRFSPFTEGLFRQIYRIFNGIDRTLLRLVPVLRRLAWYGIVHVSR